jgi:hypothetical protein
MPARTAGGIGADDMIVSKDVAKAQLFDRLSVLLDHPWIATDFGLRKDHSDAHVQILLGGLKTSDSGALRQLTRPLIFAQSVRKLGLIT